MENEIIEILSSGDEDHFLKKAKTLKHPGCTILPDGCRVGCIDVLDGPPMRNESSINLRLIFKQINPKFMIQINFMVDVDWLYNQLENSVEGVVTMFLFDHNDNLTVIIHTANLIESDWKNKTQMVFITPQLSLKKPSDLSNKSPFQLDLEDYFQGYPFAFKPYAEKIMQYDFGSIKYVENVKRTDQLICQFSSIGTLGAKPETWLLSNIKNSFGMSKCNF
ncbi:phospholipase D/nuclease, partial [Rozella allomycis CSF55]